MGGEERGHGLSPFGQEGRRGLDGDGQRVRGHLWPVGQRREAALQGHEIERPRQQGRARGALRKPVQGVLIGVHRFDGHVPARCETAAGEKGLGQRRRGRHAPAARQGLAPEVRDALRLGRGHQQVGTAVHARADDAGRSRVEKVLERRPSDDQGQVGLAIHQRLEALVGALDVVPGHLETVPLVDALLQGQVSHGVPGHALASLPDDAVQDPQLRFHRASRPPAPARAGQRLTPP